MKFKYAIKVPSLDKNIFATEIITSQQKEYLKALLQDNNLEFTRILKQLLSETIEYDDIDSLTLLDKLIILLHLRMMSIGDKIDYEFECSECKLKIKSALHIPELIQKIYNLGFMGDTIITHNPYSVVCGLPTVGTELILETDNIISASPAEITADTLSAIYNKDLLVFIKSILINNISPVSIDLSTLTVKERLLLFEKLPSKPLKEIWDKIQEIKKGLAIEVLNITCQCGHKIVESHLSISDAGYGALLKSVFGDNLHNIYQNIYYMTSVLHFTPEYVENMTPNERELYWGYYNKDEKEKKQSELEQVDK